MREWTREKISHFFEHYKDLEKGKWVKVEGWRDSAAARQEILEGVARFRALPDADKPRF
jgi:inorganic pyrophosphatase